MIEKMAYAKHEKEYQAHYNLLKETAPKQVNLLFYPSQVPVNITIYYKEEILPKVKYMFYQDYYSKTYHQISFHLCLIS